MVFQKLQGKDNHLMEELDKVDDQKMQMSGFDIDLTKNLDADERRQDISYWQGTTAAENSSVYSGR